MFLGSIEVKHLLKMGYPISSQSSLFISSENGKSEVFWSRWDKMETSARKELTLRIFKSALHCSLTTGLLHTLPFKMCLIKLVFNEEC